MLMSELLGPDDGPHIQRADNYCRIECLDCGDRLQTSGRRSGRCLPCHVKRKTGRAPSRKSNTFFGYLIGLYDATRDS